MKDLELGKTKKGRPISITPKERSTHMQIIGSTGEGKSKFMEYLIRKDILNGNGLCLIDPHGYLYEDLIKWCEEKEALKHRKLILFDPLEDNWTFGFNPLKVSTPEIAYHVDAMVKAVAKVWGGEDTDRTPLLKRCLRITFHALAEQKHSLLEARYLVNPFDDKKVRKYLTSGIQDPIIQDQWQYFNSLRSNQFYNEFGSTINRMMEFLSSPVIRNTIGQTKETIDFRKIMDESHILLVNLSAKDKISEDNARLLGTLIVNDLFMQAKSRPPGSKPFFLYIDECARYINEDVARILDEGRKFGLHLILAHQHLAQLKKAGEDVYQSVMTDAKTKVIFGGLNVEDARILAEQAFLGELDLEEAKQTLIKPAVVGYIKTWLHNYSHGTTYSEGGSAGDSSSSTFSQNESRSTAYGGDGNVMSTTIVKGSGSTSSQAYSESWNWADSTSESEGASEAYIPEMEDMPTQTYSLEEQIYRAMAVMVNQPMRHAIIKLPKKNTQMVITPFVKEIPAKEEWIREFKEQTFKLLDFVRPKAEIEIELKRRWQEIELKALPPTKEPKSYRH